MGGTGSGHIPGQWQSSVCGADTPIFQNKHFPHEQSKVWDLLDKQPRGSRFVENCASGFGLDVGSTERFRESGSIDRDIVGDTIGTLPKLRTGQGLSHEATARVRICSGQASPTRQSESLGGQPGGCLLRKMGVMLACPSPIPPVCSTPWYPPPLPRWWSTSTCPCAGPWPRPLLSCSKWWCSRSRFSFGPWVGLLVPWVKPLLPFFQGFLRQAGCLDMDLRLLAWVQYQALLLVRASVSAVRRLVHLLISPGEKNAWLHPLPHPSPSLGPSQASLLGAPALMSNILGPSEVERLKRCWTPSLTPTSGTHQ